MSEPEPSMIGCDPLFECSVIMFGRPLASFATDAVTPALLALIAETTLFKVLFVASIVICVPLIVNVPLVGVVLKPALFNAAVGVRPPPIGAVTYWPWLLSKIELLTVVTVARRVTLRL